MDPGRPRPAYAIDRVKLTWEAAYGSAYQIQTSADGTTWTTVRTVTGGNGGVDDNTALTAIGPLRAHQRHGPRHRVGLLAVRVRGLRRRHHRRPATNLALNKPATASSVESAAYPASAAVDGPPTTRWASAFADPQWIQVDLGQSYTINRVRLIWEAAYGSAYQIQTSADGTTWTTVRSVTGGNGGVDDNTGLSATGPLRAHQRHGPRHGVGLLAVQVRGLRQLARRWAREPHGSRARSTS